MDGENKVSVDRPLFPAVIEDDGDHGNDLDDHFELAQVAGFDGKSTGRGDRAQAAYQEFAADDDYCDPGGNQAGIELNQRNESGGDEKFVGHGIEQNAHGGDLAALAREVSVDAVGHGGGNENGRGEQFFRAVFAAEVAGRQDPDQQGNAADADQRNGIRQVHRSSASFRKGYRKTF